MSTMKREAVSRYVIAGALFGGAYFGLVQPAHSELKELQEQLAASGVSADEGRSVEQVLAAIEASVARAEELHDFGRYARDDAGLFARLSELAESHGVAMRQIMPSSGGPEAGSGSQAWRSGDHVAVYDMVFVGIYGDVVRFLDVMSRELGSSVVRSVSLSGSERGELVQASVRAEVHSFDASPLASGEGGVE